MRWKLMIAASLLAAVVGAGAALAVTRFALGSAPLVPAPGWLTTVALLLPLAANTFAAIFVYRHTARRRTLQAAATVLLSITLTLAALIIASRFLAPRPSPPTDTPPVKNVSRRRSSPRVRRLPSTRSLAAQA